MKKIISLLFVLLMLAGCASSKNGGEATETEKITIAYQYGLAYAPAVIAKEKGLVEEFYKNKTGKDLEVEWVQMSSGADINNGIAAGEIDAGFMGIGPAVTGISKGLNYKIFTNLSGQEHGMTSNSADINSLADLVGSEYQIALVNIGSIQHIILAKALAENGFDAHALDANIVAMKHPDGMAALESGNVSCHLTSSPYIFKERDNEALHELTEINNAWSKEKSFIVGIASTDLYENTDLYEALCNAIAQGSALINENIDEAAAIVCEFDGNSVDVEKEYLLNGYYSAETNGLLEMAKFMQENDFCNDTVKSYSDLVFDNVKGN